MVRIATDKFKHFILGAIVAGFGALALQLLWAGAGAGVLAGMAFVSALAAGVAREAWQAHTGTGQVELLDVVATAAGGVFVAIGVVLAA